MKKQSAGLLLYRGVGENTKVLIVHPGGPFWAKKDAGAWSIPKGEFVEGEEPFAAAKREFEEELGVGAPDGDPVDLGWAKQSSGKVIYVWAIEADLDTEHVKSNTFDMEWPPRSGKTQSFPEVDRAGWFSLAEARLKLVKGQVPLLENLAEVLGVHIPDEPVSEAPTPNIPAPDGTDKGQTSLF